MIVWGEHDECRNQIVFICNICFNVNIYLRLLYHFPIIKPYIIDSNWSLIIQSAKVKYFEKLFIMLSIVSIIIISTVLFCIV